MANVVDIIKTKDFVITIEDVDYYKGIPLPKGTIEIKWQTIYKIIEKIIEKSSFKTDERTSKIQIEDYTFERLFRNLLYSFLENAFEDVDFNIVNFSSSIAKFSHPLNVNIYISYLDKNKITIEDVEQYFSDEFELEPEEIEIYKGRYEEIYSMLQKIVDEINDYLATAEDKILNWIKQESQQEIENEELTERSKIKKDKTIRKRGNLIEQFEKLKELLENNKKR